MPAGDFFAFCTSLQPLELKALGALSQVRHIPEKETVYSPGDMGDTLYILNRGVIEMVQDDAKRELAATYLSRGDVFGDLEALTHVPRRHTVRQQPFFPRKYTPVFARQQELGRAGFSLQTLLNLIN